MLTTNVNTTLDCSRRNSTLPNCILLLSNPNVAELGLGSQPGMSQPSWFLIPSLFYLSTCRSSQLNCKEKYIKIVAFDVLITACLAHHIRI